MKLDINILSELIAEYENLTDALNETKSSLKNAVSTLTDNGWSGDSEAQFGLNFNLLTNYYEGFEDSVENMKSSLENIKAKASSLKNRCEDFQNSMIQGRKGSYGESCEGTKGILSLYYDYESNITNICTDILCDLVPEEEKNIKNVKNTMKKQGWFGGGLKYSTLNIGAEVEVCLDEIKKEDDRISNFKEAFQVYCDKTKELEEYVKSKLPIDEIAKDVTRDYYTPLDPNSSNYDWERIKGLMQLDPSLLSDEEYNELIKAYDKMAIEGDTESIAKFIECSYINTMDPIYSTNSNIFQKDQPKNSYELSPVFKEMSVRYKEIVNAIVNNAGGGDILSDPLNKNADLIRKSISNSDILSSIVNHASVIDGNSIESGEKLKITIEGFKINQNLDYTGNNFEISMNGKIPNAKDETNIKFTVYEIGSNQNSNIGKNIIDKLTSMEKDLGEISKDVGTDWLTGKFIDGVKGKIVDGVKGSSIKYAGLVGLAIDLGVDGVKAAADINKDYIEEKENAEERIKLGVNINFANDAKALAINSSFSASTSKDGSIEIESTYVDSEELKFRLWFYRKKAHSMNEDTAPIDNDTSIENYLIWYQSLEGEKLLDKYGEANKEEYRQSAESKMSLNQLLHGSNIKNKTAETLVK